MVSLQYMSTNPDIRRRLGESGLDAALKRLENALATRGMRVIEPASEATMWAIALNEWHKARVNSHKQYREYQRQTQDGELVAGLSYARNLLAHQLANLFMWAWIPTSPPPRRRVDRLLTRWWMRPWADYRYVRRKVGGEVLNYVEYRGDEFLPGTNYLTGPGTYRKGTDGEFWPDPNNWVRGEVRWTPLSGLPPPGKPDQVHGRDVLYDRHLAEKEPLATLRRAQRWLTTTVWQLWP